MALRSRSVIVISAVILIACVGTWFYWQGIQAPLPSSQAFREAPSFALTDVSGHEHRIQEFRGKVVLLHFWAAWCPPCLSEIPVLVSFAHKLSGNTAPIEIVTISEDSSWKAAEKVLPSAKLPKNMVSLLDHDSKASDAYGTYQFPETYLINKEGRIVTKWIGGQPWDNPKVEKFLEKQASAANAAHG